MDGGAWLRDLGLERYAEAFCDNDIDGTLLRTLTEDDVGEVCPMSNALLAAASAFLHLSTEPFLATGEFTQYQLWWLLGHSFGSVIGGFEVAILVWPTIKNTSFGKFVRDRWACELYGSSLSVTADGWADVEQQLERALEVGDARRRAGGRRWDGAGVSGEGR